MKLIFVRHGQSVYNSENRFTGWHNPPLTKTGEEQALNLVDKLNQYKIDSTYCSTLLRAKQTALIIQKNHKQISSNILYDSDLNERNYGNWSGKNKEEIKTEVGENEFLAIRRGWHKAPKEGESLEDTAKRANKWLEKIRSDSNNYNLLVVSHGNTIRALSVLLQINTKENINQFEVKTGEILII